MAIGKLIKGSGFQGAMAYVTEKDAATVLEAQGVSSANPVEAAREMRAVADSRGLSQPVLHVVLSAPHEENPSPEQWKKLAQVWMREMGYEEGQGQYLLVHHADRDHSHVHLICNRVQLNGKAIDTSHDFRRSQSALRIAEREAGMQSYEKPNKESQRGRLAGIRKCIDQAFNESKGDFNEFRASCARAGIKVELNRQSTGRISGLSFVDKDGQRFKGSMLGKAYSFTGLVRRGLTLPVRRASLKLRLPTKMRLWVIGKSAYSLRGGMLSRDKNKTEIDKWLAERKAADLANMRKKKLNEDEFE